MSRTPTLQPCVATIEGNEDIVQMNLNAVDQTFAHLHEVEDCTGCGICVDVCPVRNKRETRLKAGNLPTTPWSVDANRPRPGVVEFALRGQRGVRPRIPRLGWTNSVSSPRAAKRLPKRISG